MDIDEPRIGTAGWSIGAEYRDAFPAEGSLLERYAARFDTVEINSSFHRPHRRSTYERWPGRSAVTSASPSSCRKRSRMRVVPTALSL
jgi:hypothetical protein